MKHAPAWEVQSGEGAPSCNTKVFKESTSRGQRLDRLHGRVKFRCRRPGFDEQPRCKVRRGLDGHDRRTLADVRDGDVLIVRTALRDFEDVVGLDLHGTSL